MPPHKTAHNFIDIRRLPETNGRKEEDFSAFEWALRIGDAPTAHLLADISIAENPHDINALIDKALAHAIEGNSEQSMAYNQAALESDPNNEIALHNLGADHFEMGDYQQALDYYMASIENGGADDALAYSCVADSLIELGRIDEAMEYYEKALTSPPYSTIFIDDVQQNTAEHLGFDNAQDALQYVREQRGKSGFSPTKPSVQQTVWGIPALDDVA